ncbi:MAG: Asp-tRNA(Asn)/Glu-tRNA(Gln) amidotransferase subunit GatC [Bacteroidota bacterium]
MNFTEKQIEEIYRLAGLDPSADEKQRMITDLQEIMELTKPMTEAPAAKCRPLIYPRESLGSLREDVPDEKPDKDKKIRNRQDNKYFVVKKSLKNTSGE